MGKQALYRNPNRSESGRRFYTNEHVQRLLLVKRLMGKAFWRNLPGWITTHSTFSPCDTEQSRAANHDGGADVVGLNLTTLFERAEPSLAARSAVFRKP